MAVTERPNALTRHRSPGVYDINYLERVVLVRWEREGDGWRLCTVEGHYVGHDDRVWHLQTEQGPVSLRRSGWELSIA